MIIKKYEYYIFNVFFKSFLLVSLAFFCISIIINIFEELRFFEKIETEVYYSIYLSFLNAPSLLFEIFPFIFLITAKLFFIRLSDKKEIEILKINGIGNIKIIYLLSILSAIVGIFILLFFYSISAKLKSNYLDIKNNFSNNNEFLAVVNDNGLWIKEEIDENVYIINAEKFEQNILKNITITETNKYFQKNSTLFAERADISAKNWKLFKVKILNDDGSKDKFKSYVYNSTFDSEIISNLFSNLNSKNIFQLNQILKNYLKIGFSDIDIKLHLNKIYSMPLYYILMTILGYIIITKINFIKSKFFTIILGVLVSVLVYYLNYFSHLLGTNGSIPILISVWLPHVILFLICNIGLVRINEKN